MKNHLIFLLSMLCTLTLFPVQGQQGGIESLRETGKAFEHVVQQVSPSVVSIRTENVDTMKPAETLPFPEEWPFGNELFDRFFGNAIPHAPPQDVPRQKRSVTGQGSGFIYRVDEAAFSDSAYVLTNNHVVENAGRIRVTLRDGREFDAEIKGADPMSDVAVLEIGTADVKALPLGDSSTLAVGEWVLAIGSPFGLQHTLTVGVVSAKGRTSLGISDYEDFIQTDAAINPGNSGGPLVNLDGSVVAMNTAILSRSGSYMGIGFAIPINLARNVADQLIDEGEVVRGFLGIVIQKLTPDLAKSFGVDAGEGILVAKVNEDSPADRAGLEQGDVIVRYRDKPVTDIGDFRNRVAQTAPGTRAELGIVRDGEESTLAVVIGRLNGERQAAAQQTESVARLGLAVQTLTPELAEQFGIETGRGVIVTRVDSGSVAAREGIETGTVILQVDRRNVSTAAEFEDAVRRSSADKEVLLLVKTDDFQQYVILEWR